MDRSDLAIVIPAFNESATIVTVVCATLDYGTPIVVDDGSSDETAELAYAAGAVVVSHAVNAGYDAALNSGFMQAAELGCGYVITMDADGQHDPAILGKFVQALGRGADLVVGVRDRRQRLAEHVFAWIGKRAWGITDPMCGLKGYRIELYRELGHFDSYQSIGTELAIFAALQDKTIKQTPVKTRPRIDAPRFGRRFNGNLRILRSLMRALFGSS